MTKKTLEETYVKKTQHQHILDLPDTYIGSVETVKYIETYIYENQKIVKKPIDFNPGLYKIFDEILVNACDQTIRDQPNCNTIKVSFDKEENSITVINNGIGIPCVLHKEHNIYIPELLFGNLLTSSNYDKNEEKVTGGKNGYGSTVTCIFSKKFIVDIVDEKNKLHYYQEFSNNMFEKTEAKIKSCNKKGYVSITFIPDYPKFGMTCLTNDTIKVLSKRVIDCSITTDKNVNVYLDNEKIKIKKMEDYVALFENLQKPIVNHIFEDEKYKWEMCVCISETYAQHSFVNSIYTSKGGKHVDYIMKQITDKLGELINTKKKIENLKTSFIKDRLTIFLKSTVVNPSFDSQTKDTLTTTSSKFGVKIEVPDKVIEKIYKSGLVEDIISYTKFKNQKLLEKSSGNTSRKSKLKIEKLEDANFAGTSKSEKCTLFLVEGDSAKTFAMSGFSVIGRDYYGAYALRGKMLNIREATQKQLLENNEIKNVKEILGLVQGKKYTDLKTLRYSKVVLLCDADVDAIHIQSLFLNMISTWWPELLELNFVRYFKTPLIKITKGTNVKEFYSTREYEEYIEKNSINMKGYNIKYYKGLGTSTSNEAKEIFKKMNENIINYTSSSPEETENAIKLAFEKKQADNRKQWLLDYEPKDPNITKDISIKDFINNNLIEFSMYDIKRSIPSLVDGFKPSQRKVIYTMFKKNYTKEIKVAQLASAVAELTSYHHGETSLQGTIINLAQNYTGSNNWNLLEPKGQFGSRVQEGKDAASPRYIFTELSEHAKKLFNKQDFQILKYLEDEQISIEPEYYVPVLPIVLINGTEGIGTGFSTSIPSFNPEDIILNMKNLINGKELIELVPWCNNFNGTIVKDTTKKGSFIVKGKLVNLENNYIKITEIPIKTSIESYQQFLETLVENNNFGITDFTSNCSDTHIEFLLKFNSLDSKKQFLEKGKSDIYDILKLTKTISTRNMHLFDNFNNIKKYDSAEDILKEFYKIRLEYNQKRKDNLIKEINEDLVIVTNRLRFLNEIIGEIIMIYKKTGKEIEAILTKSKYDLVNNGYNYLTDMNIGSFNKEKMTNLENKKQMLEKELHLIKNKTVKQMLLDDLDI